MLQGDFVCKLLIGNDQSFQLLCGNTRGILLTLDQTDQTLGDLFQKIDLVHVVLFVDHILGNKADAKVGFYHGQDLVGGGGFDGGIEGDAVGFEDIGIPLVGFGAGSQQNDRIILQSDKRDFFSQQLGICLTANSHLVDGAYGFFDDRA